MNVKSYIAYLLGETRFYKWLYKSLKLTDNIYIFFFFLIKYGKRITRFYQNNEEEEWENGCERWFVSLWHITTGEIPLWYYDPQNILFRANRRHWVTAGRIWIPRGAPLEQQQPWERTLIYRYRSGGERTLPNCSRQRLKISGRDGCAALRGGVDPPGWPKRAPGSFTASELETEGPGPTFTLHLSENLALGLEENLARAPLEPIGALPKSYATSSVFHNSSSLCIIPCLI
jgi:hypothetical protein